MKLFKMNNQYEPNNELFESGDFVEICKAFDEKKDDKDEIIRS